jgi:glycosyltransferase involved in cell wall biosynthesis
LFHAIRRRGSLATKIVLGAYCMLRRLDQVALAADYDLVVLHREAFPFLAPAVEDWVMARNRKVIYSFDDAVHVRRQEASTFNHPWLYNIKYGPGINRVIAGSVHVIAGNAVLAEHARKLNGAVSVMPTVVDLERYVFSPKRPDHAPVTIGWYGSNTTSPYLSALEPALRKVAEANPGRVRFRFFGDPSCRLALPYSASLPFRLDSEIDDLRQIDIGLMPMPDSPWTRGKCAFKAIQYMATGAAAIVSPVGMATELVQDGVNGLYARNTAEWYDRMQQLNDDVALRRKLVLEGRRTIERGYSVQLWAPRLLQLLENVIRGRAASAFAAD